MAALDSMQCLQVMPLRRQLMQLLGPDVATHTVDRRARTGRFFLSAFSAFCFFSLTFSLSPSWICIHLGTAVVSPFR